MLLPTPAVSKWEFQLMKVGQTCQNRSSKVAALAPCPLNNTCPSTAYTSCVKNLATEPSTNGEFIFLAEVRREVSNRGLKWHPCLPAYRSPVLSKLHDILVSNVSVTETPRFISVHSFQLIYFNKLYRNDETAYLIWRSYQYF